jgi:Rrf2 family transcriptional regulator, iron-sulfur cluster assembly transcription factor
MFSKSCEYAIRAVLHLAAHANEEKKLGAKEIAEALEVPKPFLAKLLQQLAKHHLIASSKGAGGGFYLAQENQELSLADVIRCIDGNDLFSSCVLGLPICSSENPCPLHYHAIAFRQSVEQMQPITALARDLKEKKSI